MNSAHRHGIGYVLCLLYFAACSSSMPGGSASAAPIGTMIARAGDNQVVLVDTRTPIAPSVKVTNNAGTPIAGVPVTFTVPEYSGGDAAAGAVTTGADGVATVSWWLVYGIAGTSALTATAANVTGSPVTFTATVLGRFRAYAVNGTDHQSAAAGTSVPIAPAISVISLDGEPPAGIPVVFTVLSGGGTVTGDTAIITASHTATVDGWTLGPTPGVNQLRAVILQPLGSDSVTFTATGT